MTVRCKEGNMEKAIWFMRIGKLLESVDDKIDCLYKLWDHLRSGGKDVPQVSAFLLPLLVLFAALLITDIQVRQHYKTIVMVVHSVFTADISDAEELLPLLILSSLLDDPPIIRIFLLLLPLFVLHYIAVQVQVDDVTVDDDDFTSHYLFFALVVAIDAVLVLLDQPDLPHLASASHLCQGHPTTL